MANTKGRLTLHFLPGYAPNLDPDELAWIHTKHTGEKLKEQVDAQLQSVAIDPALTKSFFRHPSVAYIFDL